FETGTLVNVQSRPLFVVVASSKSNLSSPASDSTAAQAWNSSRKKTLATLDPGRLGVISVQCWPLSPVQNKRPSSTHPFDGARSCIVELDGVSWIAKAEEHRNTKHSEARRSFIFGSPFQVHHSNWAAFLAIFAH